MRGENEKSSPFVREHSRTHAPHDKQRPRCGTGAGENFCLPAGKPAVFIKSGHQGCADGVSGKNAHEKAETSGAARAEQRMRKRSECTGYFFRAARNLQKGNDEEKGKDGGQHVQRPKPDSVQTDGDIPVRKQRKQQGKKQQGRGERAPEERDPALRTCVLHRERRWPGRGGSRSGAGRTRGAGRSGRSRGNGRNRRIFHHGLSLCAPG